MAKANQEALTVLPVVCFDPRLYGKVGQKMIFSLLGAKQFEKLLAPVAGPVRRAEGLPISSRRTVNMT